MLLLQVKLRLIVNFNCGFTPTGLQENRNSMGLKVLTIFNIIETPYSVALYKPCIRLSINFELFPSLLDFIEQMEGGIERIKFSCFIRIINGNLLYHHLFIFPFQKDIGLILMSIFRCMFTVAQRSSFVI